MTKRKPICIIKDCNRRGKRKIRFDIGPTLGDAIVPDNARIHTKMVCDTHLKMLSETYLEGLKQGVSETQSNN
jgi:hypothetical protein